MTYQDIYHPERYDLRDSYWEFLSVQEGEMTARVNDVNILSGQHQGQVIDTAVVTFRGFRMEWIKIIEEGEDVVSIPENPVALLTDGPYFVFSYWSDNHECELAALGDQLFAMLFAFDSAEITWDTFCEEPVGTPIPAQ